MSRAVMDRIIKDLGTLSSDERAEIHALTGNGSELTPEAEAKRRMIAEEYGIWITPRKPGPPLSEPRPPLLKVTGKPVSETIIEERR